MPNLVGIGNSQVPTNAMLGGLAYQDSVGEINIEKIKARIFDTALNVFVYDTRKDSDGGAWRYHTQNTSWYNEVVSAERGARREFPSVAVIVVTSTVITIYDGDDPNLPMWMVLKEGGNRSMLYSSSGSDFSGGISALNGNIYYGMTGNGMLGIIEFVRDSSFKHRNNNRTNRGRWRGTIADRNLALGWSTENDIRLAGEGIFDIVTKVLPNAPIDVFTGLPIPTVAAASNSVSGGASVIKHDGSIVDITHSNNGYLHVTQIDIDEKYVYMGFGASSSYVGGIGYAVPIPSADVSLGSIVNATSNADFRWSSNSTSGSGGQSNYYINPSDSNDDDVKGMVLTKRGLSFATESGASILLNNQRDTNGSVAFITSSFNSGYMHGDIKGAFLSDTDTTNITSGEILSNGDFTNGTTGWTLQDASEGSISVSNNQLTLNNTTSSDPPVACYQQISLEVGQYYNLTSVHVSGNVSVVNITTGTSNGGGTGGYGNVVYHDATGSTRSATFLATHATMYCYIRVNTNGTGTTVINSVSIRKAEEDRSVNGAFARDNVSALTINGTITKKPVATGAELVSYSGFEIPESGVSLSVTNGLIQPYNSSLSGTQFVFSGWFKTSSNSDYQYVVQISDTSTNQTIGGVSIFLDSGGSAGLPYMFSATGSSNGELYAFPGSRVDDNTWHHFVAIFDNTNKTLYIDGVSRGSSSISGTITTPFNGAEVYIGMHRQIRSGGDNKYRHYLRGDAALIRISKTIPTDEQIKKIYNDERCLYHENAKCTLYGTSDNVKAIAYDDSNGVLHVGTSAGRSEFQGLNRINNTTTAVATAISASNELVAEQ